MGLWNLKMTEYTHNTRYPGENDAYRIAGNELLKTNLVVVIKSPIGRIMDFARSRNWQDIKLLSSFNNNYNSDYLAETPGGNQLPACNAFTKKPDGIYHLNSTEIPYTPLEGHQDIWI